MSGIKHDAGKPDLSLIPYVALVEEARGFMLGESKYGRYNYAEGMEVTRLTSAALRHIYQWLAGEDKDPESGANHLGHARCCLAMVISTMALGTAIDNRHKKKQNVTYLDYPGSHTDLLSVRSHSNAKL